MKNETMIVKMTFDDVVWYIGVDKNTGEYLTPRHKDINEIKKALAEI